MSFHFPVSSASASGTQGLTNLNASGFASGGTMADSLSTPQISPMQDDKDTRKKSLGGTNHTAIDASYRPVAYRTEGMLLLSSRACRALERFCSLIFAIILAHSCFRCAVSMSC
jgi:hypothetical protein